MNFRKVLVVALVLTLAGCSKKPPVGESVRPVKVKDAETYFAKKGSRYSATIRPNSQVEISFKVGGYVETIADAADVNGVRRLLQAGDTVSRGQFLAQLRRSDYETKVAQAVAQKGEIVKSADTTRAQIAEAEATVTINKSQVAEAETNLAQAQTDLTRARNLFDVQSLTKKDLDSANTNFELARKRVETARASLNTAHSRIKTIRTQIDLNQAEVNTADTVVRQAEIPLGDTTLRAPLSGVVIERKIEFGALVAPNAPAFVLADTSSVKAVFGVPDIELQKLRTGQTLTVTTDMLPDQEFSGRVSGIAPSADTSSRVFEVEVTIPNPQNLLKPGMITSLELNSESSDIGQVVVSLGSIVRSKTNPERYAVFLIQEIDGVRTARSREVVLGETLGNAVAITEGVQAGEKVVINGAEFLTDGEKVQIVP